MRRLETSIVIIFDMNLKRSKNKLSSEFTLNNGYVYSCIRVLKILCSIKSHIIRIKQKKNCSSASVIFFLLSWLLFFLFVAIVDHVLKRAYRSLYVSDGSEELIITPHAFWTIYLVHIFSVIWWCWNWSRNHDYIL